MIRSNQDVNQVTFLWFWRVDEQRDLQSYRLNQKNSHFLQIVFDCLTGNHFHRLLNEDEKTRMTNTVEVQMADTSL
jgi:hypothetical protein